MTAGPGEIAVLVGYMPIIVRDGGISDWERKFCASITARHRRGPFTPSARQIDVMRRIVREFQHRRMRDDPLVERDEVSG